MFTIVQKLYGKPGRRKSAGETPVETLVRIQHSCSDLLWRRYPGVCHLCYARRSADHVRGAKLLEQCDCFEQKPDYRDRNAKRADQKSLRKFSESVRQRKPKGIDEWQVMFGAIFDRNIQRLSPVEIGFHLLEELGEVSDAMVRMYSYRNDNFSLGEPNWRRARLEDQIADAFSGFLRLYTNSVP